jgi:DNA-directed RNA polymerase specialized sigma24 family protein
VCGDFYIYALDRLESVIRNFPTDAPGKFKTWLNYVLRNQFVNYLRSVVREDTVVLAPEEFEERLAGEFAPTKRTISRLREGLDKIPSAIRT